MFAGYTFEGSKPKHAAPASCPATKGLPPASAIAEWRNRNEKQMADRGGEVAFSALPGCAVKRRWSTSGVHPPERFLSAQADPFAGAKGEEKASACSVRNDR